MSLDGHCRLVVKGSNRLVFLLTSKKSGLYEALGFIDVYCFHSLGPKYSLWVLVRIASARPFQRVPTIYVLNKNKKKHQIFQLKIFTFYKNMYIT